MSINAGALRELHRNHRQLPDLRERLARGPKKVGGTESAVERCENDLKQNKEKLKRCRVFSDEKQLQLKEREDKIKDLQLKLNSCSSNREYQALSEQIAADEQANNVLSDEILESLEKIDDNEAAVSAAVAGFEKAKQDLVGATKRVEDMQPGLQSELERVSQELKQAESALPSDFKTDYDRIVESRGEDALAQIEDDCCGGCYHKLTPQTLNLLSMLRPVFCKNCGCLLYIPEDRSPAPANRD